MTTTPWWLYVLPAVITGLVAIVVQIVSARVTAKREQARLDFERERWESDRTAAEQRQFQADKQRLFVDYLANLEGYAKHAVAVGEANRLGPAYREFLNDLVEISSELSAREKEFALIAADILPVIGEVKVFIGETYDLEDENERLQMMLETSSHFEKLEAAMRKSLGVGDGNIVPHVHPQLTKHHLESYREFMKQRGIDT